MADETELGPAEGPMEHDARVRAERSYLERLSQGAREAFDRSTGGRPELVSKRLLVAVSHAIEKAVMSASRERPIVVVALFQQLRFFDRERAVYERMAREGIHVIVGFVRGERHEPPPGVHTVLLDTDEALADEWSVVAVGPRAGAFLVATDQHRLDAAERNVEMSRQFAGRWGFSGNQGAWELARLRLVLGDRLPPNLLHVVDELLAEAMPTGGELARTSGSMGEIWATTVLYHLLEKMHSAQNGTRELRRQLEESHLAAAARAAATVDPDSGLPTAELLTRWAEHPEGTELPVGLAVFRLPELADDVIRGDARAAYYAARQAAAALSQPLGPVDVVIRLSTTNFLLIVPGASHRHLAGLCDRVSEGLVLASRGYPHIELVATVASVVTRTRPLPVRELQDALNQHDHHSPGPAPAGRTEAGDTITVASTRMYRGDPAGPGHPGPPPLAPVPRPRPTPRVSDPEPARYAPERFADTAGDGYPAEPPYVGADGYSEAGPDARHSPPPEHAPRFDHERLADPTDPPLFDDAAHYPPPHYPVAPDAAPRDPVGDTSYYPGEPRTAGWWDANPSMSRQDDPPVHRNGY